MGNAGILLTRVRYIKETAQKKFAIIDAGMNDLIRPALYGSYHEIVPVEGRGDSPNRPEPSRSRFKNTIKREKIDIVGPVCESGDFFAQDREMPELRAGDLLAVMSAGAYGFVMASNYNSRPLPAEALVRADKVALIRRRCPRSCPESATRISESYSVVECGNWRSSSWAVGKRVGHFVRYSASRWSRHSVQERNGSCSFLGR